jgi:hypothetical protein
MRSLLLRIACLYIRNHVINQMTKAGWTKHATNPAHWNTKPQVIDGHEHKTSVHEVSAAGMLLTDTLNDLYHE